MKLKRRYELMILINESLNDSELKSWVFSYAKNLRKFNVSNISVISRGKQRLAYPIFDKLKGNYIQLNFSSVPKYADKLLINLKFDLKVLRYLLISKKITKT